MNIYSVRLSALSTPYSNGQRHRHSFTVWVVCDDILDAIQSAKSIHDEPHVIGVTQQNGESNRVLILNESGETP